MGTPVWRREPRRLAVLLLALLLVATLLPTSSRAADSTVTVAGQLFETDGETLHGDSYRIDFISEDDAEAGEGAGWELFDSSDWSIELPAEEDGTWALRAVADDWTGGVLQQPLSQEVLVHVADGEVTRPDGTDLSSADTQLVLQPPTVSGSLVDPTDPSATFAEAQLDGHRVEGRSPFASIPGGFRGGLSLDGGAYQLHLPDGDYVFRAVTEDEGTLDGTSRYVEVAVDGNEVEIDDGSDPDALDLEIGSGNVRGQVLPTEGEELPDSALVNIDVMDSPLPVTSTDMGYDENGEFAFELPDGDYRLRVILIDSEQLEPEPLDITITDGVAVPAPSHDLQLISPTLSLTVRNADGSDCTGCELEAVRDGDGAIETAFLGAQAYPYHLVLDDGTWQLTVEDPMAGERAGPFEVEVVDGVADPSELTLDLDPPTIDLVALDHAGEPCTSCDLQARRTVDGVEDFAVFSPHAAGEFRETLEDGDWRLQLERHGTGGVSQPVTTTVEDGVADPSLGDQLQLAEPNLVGELRDLSGDPQPGHVWVEPDDDNASFAARGPITVDEDGTFGTWVGDGTIDLTGALEVGDDEQPVEPAEITMQGGEPSPANPQILAPAPTGVPVQLRADGTNVSGEVRVLGDGDTTVPDGFHRFPTDGDGPATVQLPPGDYRLRGAPDPVGEYSTSDDLPVEVTGEHVLVDGEVAEDLTLELRPATLHGRLLDVDGEPTAAARAVARDGEGTDVADLERDDEGNYALRLPEGTFDVRAEPDESTLAAPSVTHEITVDGEGGLEGVQPPLDLRLREPNLAGQVLDPDGTDATAPTVEIVERDQRQPVATLHTVGGSFAALLEDGDYDLVAAPNLTVGLAPSLPVGISVDDGVVEVAAPSEQSPEPDPLALEVSLREPWIEGTFHEEDGTALAGAILFFERQEDAPAPPWRYPAGEPVAIEVQQDGSWGTGLPDGDWRIADADEVDQPTLAELTVTDGIAGTTEPDSPFELVRDPGNVPPEVSQLTTNPTRGTAPLEVQMLVQVEDPDDDELTYTVDWGDDTTDDELQGGHSPSPTHTYATWGDYELTVTVTDSAGGQDTASTTVDVLAATTTTLELPDDATVYGEEFTLDADVTVTDSTAGTPTGDVEFLLDDEVRGVDRLDDDGRASIDVNMVDAGDREIVARYLGDDDRGASKSPATTHTVEPAATRVAVGTSPSWLQPGQPVTLTSEVTAVEPSTATPDGPRTLELRSLDDESLVHSDDDPPPHIHFDEGLDRGDYGVDVTYAGSDNFLPSQGDRRLVVSPLREEPEDPDDPGAGNDGGLGGVGGTGWGAGGAPGPGDDPDPEEGIGWTSFPPADGPLVDVATSEYLHCLVRFEGDLVPAVTARGTPVFAGGDTLDAPYPTPPEGTNCITIVEVDGQVFAPTPDLRPGSVIGVSGYQPVSQTEVTGTGTPADPWQVETVVDLGQSGMQARQIDEFVAGEPFHHSTVEVLDAPADAEIDIRRYAHCGVSNDVLGYPVNDEEAGAVGCREWAIADDGTPTGRGERALVMAPTDPPEDPRGSGYRYGEPSDVTFEVLRPEGIERRLVGCEDESDNALAVSRPGATVTFTTGLELVTDQDCTERPGTAPQLSAADPTVLTASLRGERSATSTFLAEDDDPLPLEFDWELREVADGPPVSDFEVDCEAEGENPATLTCSFTTEVEGAIEVRATVTDADGREAGPRTLRLEGLTGGGTDLERLHYAGLGDSYSSGEGTGTYESGTDTASNGCRRSPDAYPRLLAGLLPDEDREAMDFAACSGAVHADLFAAPDRDDREGEGPQVDVVEADTGLVTVTIGGNDVGFAPIIAYCLAADSCHETFQLDGRDAIVDAIDGVGAEVADALSDVRGRSNATVAVLGYPQILTGDTSCLDFPWFLTGDAMAELEESADGDVGDDLQALYELALERGLFDEPGWTPGLSSDEVDWLRARTSQMNEVLGDAAAAAGVNFVDVEDVFDTSICGLDSAVVRPFDQWGDLTAWFHPNAEGHQRLYEALLGSAAEPGERALNPLPGTPMPEIEDRPRFRVESGGAFGIGLAESLAPWIVGEATSYVLRLKLDPSGYIADAIGEGVSAVVEDLAPHASYELLFHSEPTSMGVFQTDEHGTLHIDAEWPEDIEPGYHALTLTGQDPGGDDGDQVRMVVPVSVEAADDPDDPGSPTNPPGADDDEAPEDETTEDDASTGDPGDGDAEAPSPGEEDEGFAGPWITCESVLTADPFPDVAAASTHGPAIACAAAHDLVRGRESGLYVPSDDLTRGQAASMLYRALVGSLDLVSDPARLPEDAVGSAHADAIAALVAAGIVEGFADGTYRPTASITRAQFVALISRSHAALGYATEPDVDHGMSDVAGSVHEAAISWAAEDIVMGYADGTFRPSEPIDRAQTASVLTRWLRGPSDD